MFHRPFGISLILSISFLLLYKSDAYSRLEYALPDNHEFDECVKGCECVSNSNGQKLLNCANAGLRDPRLRSKNYFPDIIDLSSNSITYLSPSDILESEEQRANVKHIDVSHNQIEIIDAGFLKEFPNLKTLNVNHNRLGRVLREDRLMIERLFKHKNNLSELYLNDNEITAIDSFTFDATSLKILHMDNNNLSKVAINFTNASKLEELSFRNCSLEKLIAVAPVLSILSSNLKRWYLSDNPHLTTQYLPSIEMKKLEVLDLSGAGIERLNSFWLNAPELKELYLHKMPNLTVIEVDAFYYLQKLKILELQQSSRLEKIYPPIFDRRHTKLERLNLEYCNLTTLSFDMVKWHQIENLFIGGNPYRCDERLKWLMDDTEVKIDKVGPEPRCAEPPELRGQRLVDIRVVQNIKKATPKLLESTRRIFYKRTRLFERVSTKSSPYWNFMSTEQPDLSYQITDLIRQLIDQFREATKKPQIQFGAGFISAILVINIAYCTFKLIYKLLNFTSQKTVPPMVNLCREIGWKVYPFVLAIGNGFSRLVQAIMKRRNDLNAYQKQNLLSNAEKIDTTNPNIVLVYDREGQHASIVE